MDLPVPTDFEVIYYVWADNGAVQEPFGLQQAARDYVQDERGKGHSMPDAKLVRKSFSGKIVGVEAI